MISEAVRSICGYDHIHVNHRDDIILDEKWKISGSAARLLRTSSLHHCTLLVKSDIEQLNKVLNSKTGDSIETSATRSLRVDVKCLADVGTLI